MSVLLIQAAVTYTDARWISVGITLVILIGAILLVGASAQAVNTATGKKTPGYLRILLGADGRVSTSRTVALAWTAIVVYMLLALIIANPPSWSDALQNLSPTYLLLLGFPYASLVLAKATVATRVGSGSLAKPPPDEGPQLSQLFADDDGNPDVFDVQYVAFNVVAMVFVIVAFGRAGLTTGFPAIPDGLLLLTGGPAAIYVSNKFMPGGAPAIFSVSPGQVRVGQSFTVIGQNLSSSDPSAANPTVKVGSVEVPGGGTYAPTSLTVAAPDVGADLGRAVDVSVTISGGLQAVVPNALQVLGRVPALDGTDRGVADVGDDVSLSGDWTAAEATQIVVVVDGSVFAAIKRRGATTLTFVVPPLPNLDTPRSVTITVKLGDEISNAVPLLVSAATLAAGNGAGPSASSGIRVGT